MSHRSSQRERDHALKDRPPSKSFLKLGNTLTVTKRYRTQYYTDTTEINQEPRQYIRELVYSHFFEPTCSENINTTEKSVFLISHLKCGKLGFVSTKTL